MPRGLASGLTGCSVGAVLPLLMVIFGPRHCTVSNPWPSPLRQDFLPADIQTQFAVSRELIRNIYNSFHKLRDRAERIASRAIDNAADLLIFGKELRQVAQPVPQGSARWGGACRCPGGVLAWTHTCTDLGHFWKGELGAGDMGQGGKEKETGAFRQGNMGPGIQGRVFSLRSGLGLKGHQAVTSHDSALPLPPAGSRTMCTHAHAPWGLLARTVLEDCPRGLRVGLRPCLSIMGLACPDHLPGLECPSLSPFPLVL